MKLTELEFNEAIVYLENTLLENNVDLATRKLQYFCSDAFSNLSENEKIKEIKKFLEIPDLNKPKAFRNKNFNEIKNKILKMNKNLKIKIAEDLKELLPENYNLNNIIIEEEKNSNFEGADLFFTYKDEKIFIETKFGNETLSNIGNKRMNEIFSLNNSKNDFITFCKNIIDSQRDLVDHNLNLNADQLFSRLEINLQKEFNKLEQKLKSVKLKVNQEEIHKLLNSTGKSQFFKYFVKYNILYDKIFSVKIDKTSINDFKLKEIKMSKNRLNIYIENDIVVLRFMIESKNNKFYKGKKFPSKLCLGTICWNVFKQNK